MNSCNKIPVFYFPTIPIDIERPNKPLRNIDYTDPKIQKLIEYEQSDTKTKNRISAQRWRDSKINHIFDMEDANFALRSQCLRLLVQMTRLTTENRVLEEEIEMVRQFLSKIKK